MGEDQLKRAADLKLWLESRIAELQEETERLKEALAMADGILRASSFRPAIEVSPRVREGVTQIPEIRELRRDKGGETVAVAQVTQSKVVIEPVAEVTLRSETPPFKSFLMGKILSGMKAGDEDLAAKGKVRRGEELRYSMTERSGKVASITIENYREKERLNEILKTVAWTFSRMLEKEPTSSR